MSYEQCLRNSGCNTEVRDEGFWQCQGSRDHDKLTKIGSVGIKDKIQD